MIGQLAHGAEVGILCALAEAGQLEVLVHTVAKQSGHEWYPSRQCEEKTPSEFHSASKRQAPACRAKTQESAPGVDPTHSKRSGDPSSAAQRLT